LSNSLGGEIKLEEVAISEILVADMASESSAMLDYFEEEEEEEQQQQPVSRSSHNKQWPTISTQLLCHLCSSCGQRKGKVRQM